MIELSSTSKNSFDKNLDDTHFEASYLGRIDYKVAESIQFNLHHLAQIKKLNSIMGLEHPAVITSGYRSQAELNSTNLQCDIPLVHSSRGGLMTIHSEGQLVIYPIINLRQKNWGVKEYVFKLLDTTQKLLLELGIDSKIDSEAVGLYTVSGKIAFCGIQIKNGISLHGISLNVRNDLSLFKSIVACGVENPSLDRLQNHGINLTLEEIFHQWVKTFLRRSQNDTSRHL